MDRFARSSADDRLAAINEAASRLDLPATIIEKDFWVCWTLRRLAENPAIAPFLTFKGGTSLSKAYGIIDRFSEDIDLTIGREAPFVRETAPPPEMGASNAQLKRWTEAVTAASECFIGDVVLVELRKVIGDALGTDEGWTVDAAVNDRQTLLFRYPHLAIYGRYVGGAGINEAPLGIFMVNEGPEFKPGYIAPQIKLEFGARNEIEPNETRVIKPYLADAFPALLPDAVTPFSTLTAARTFWEKLTILHALHHNGKIRGRLSRHYYDVHMLTTKGVAATALEAPELLARVVRMKSLLWRDASASYDTAVLGTLKLVPSEAGLIDLKRDYAAMTEMFMGEVPTFDTVMTTVAELEKSINLR